MSKSTILPDDYIDNDENMHYHFLKRTEKMFITQ
jgi:hypothetical protein